MPDFQPCAACGDRNTAVYVTGPIARKWGFCDWSCLSNWIRKRGWT